MSAKSASEVTIAETVPHQEGDLRNLLRSQFMRLKAYTVDHRAGHTRLFLGFFLLVAALPTFMGNNFSPMVLDWALWAGLAFGLWQARDAEAWRSPAIVLMIAFWVVYAAMLPVTTAWNPDLKDVTREVSAMQRYGLYSFAVLFLTVGSFRNLRRMLVWWCLVFYLALPIAIWEMITHNHLDDPATPWKGPAESPMAMYFNPNNYACVIVMCCSAALAWLLLRPRRGIRIVLWVLLAAAFPIIWFTYSRAALLAYLAIIAFTVATNFWLYHRHPGRISAVLHTHRRLLAGLAAVVVLGGIASLTVPGIKENNPIVQTVASSSATEKSDNARIKWTIAGLKYFKQNPITGIGAGAFERKFARHAPAYGLEVVNLHNGIVELLCQYGIIVSMWLLGLLTYLIGQAGYVLALRKRFSAAAGAWAAGQLMFVLSYLVMAVTVSSSVTLLAWWLCLSAAVAISWYLSREMRRERLARKAPTHPDATSTPATSAPSTPATAGTMQGEGI